MIGFLGIPLVNYVLIPLVICFVGESINRRLNEWAEYRHDPVFDPDGVGKAHAEYQNKWISDSRKVFRVGYIICAVLAVAVLAYNK